MTVKMKKKAKREETPKEIVLEQIPEVSEDQCLEISDTEGLEGKS